MNPWFGCVFKVKTKRTGFHYMRNEKISFKFKVSGSKLVAKSFKVQPGTWNFLI